MSAAGPYVARGADGGSLPLVGLLKASGLQTAGAFEVIVYEGPIQPPPHIHREHDEAFYILGGSFVFTLDREQIDVGGGDFVYVSRGTRHGFTASEDAKALLLTVPAGLAGFLEELGTGIATGKTSEETRAALAGRYDSFPSP
jgi:mannose-6-phosphate isomerase-like protein (cupin superfamily)